MERLSVHKVLRKVALSTPIVVKSLTTFNGILFSGTVAEYMKKNEPIIHIVVEIEVDGSTLIITALD